MYAATDTDPALVSAAVRLAEETSAVVVAAAPVTDTVKSVVDGFVRDTIDRDGLVAVRLPVVVPAELADGVDPPGADLAGWVARVRQSGALAFLDVRG